MFYGMIKAILSPIFRLLFRIRLDGVENIPESGGLIIACNHQAFCDSLFLPFAVPRRVTFVAKAEYFESWKTRSVLSRRRPDPDGALRWVGLPEVAR